MVCRPGSHREAQRQAAARRGDYDTGIMQPSAQSSSGSSLCAFSAISGELAQVRALIEQELEDCSGAVRELAGCIGAGRGKMIRPGLLLLSGLACGELNEEHIRTAAVIEMIHNATLLHDDVLDDGKSRRGVATLNSMRGNESAVLYGDFLLSRVFRICVGLNGRAAEMIAKAAVRTCEGELGQIAQRGNRQLSEEEYIEIISQKTAALFETACSVGAMLAGGDKKQIDMLAEFGKKLGIAFQITDDVLDLVGDEAKTGKPTGSDLDGFKLTLAVIHFLRSADDADRRKAMEILSEQADGGQKATGRETLVGMLKSYESIEYARKRAGEYIKEAIGAIEGVGDGRSKASLIEVSRFIGQRTV